MTDETSDSSTLVADTPVESETAAVEPTPTSVAPVPFWQRPNVERYLAPLLTPVLVVIGLVVYVLNLSRVFLSAHGHIAVVVGSILTAFILIGATVLSNSPRLRGQSITFMTVIFLFVVLGSGWLVLGHSQEKKEASQPIPKTGPVSGTFNISALATIKFTPVSLTMPTGVYGVSLTDTVAAPHTLNFDDAKTLFAGLQVNNSGEKQSARIFFGEPGDYTYFCAVPGHRTAGMQGVVHVTGSPITLADAEAKGK